MAILNDLIGQRFGRFTVVSRYPENDRWGKAQWVCLCDCGNERTIVGSTLTRGRSASCGCSRLTYQPKEFDRRLYLIWSALRLRCENGHSIAAKSWLDYYARFKSWAYKNGYTDKSILTRYNDNKMFSKNNCHWISSD